MTLPDTCEFILTTMKGESPQLEPKMVIGRSSLAERMRKANPSQAGKIL